MFFSSEFLDVINVLLLISSVVIEIVLYLIWRPPKANIVKWHWPHFNLSKKHDLKIIVCDRVTNKNITAAEIGLYFGGRLVANGKTNSNGRAHIRYSEDIEQLTYRVTKHGYLSVSDTVDNSNIFVSLEPLKNIAHYFEILSPKTIYYFFVILKYTLLICLVSGTIISLSLINSTDRNAWLMIILYCSLWICFFLVWSSKSLRIRVIDQQTGQSLPFAWLTAIYNNRAIYRVTNSAGETSSLYPLPQSVTVIKHGYKSLENYAIPMASVGPDVVILGMTRLATKLKHNSVLANLD